MSRSQALSLLRRAAERARAEHGESAVLVGLSGGKDSSVVLDLAAGVFERVEAFYMYLVDGLECVETPLHALAARYGVKLHKVPHFDLARYLKYGVYTPPRNGGAHRIRDLRYADVEALAKARAGITWTALGHRASDSLERNAMLKRLAGLDPKARRVYPIWSWKPRDVYAYLRQRRIPVPPQLVAGTTDGINLYPETLRVLKARYPADYRRVLEVFPYAEAAIVREELRQKLGAGRAGAEPVSKVHDGAHAPGADQGRSVQPEDD